MFWDKKTPEPLKPGLCECGHQRCCHKEGTGRCTVAYPADIEWPNGAVCACKIYILGRDDDDDDTPETISPDELERLYKK